MEGLVSQMEAEMAQMRERLRRGQEERECVQCKKRLEEGESEVSEEG